MSPDQQEDILAKIDEAVGPPENETPEEREQRLATVTRRLEARRIRRAGSLMQ